MTYSHDWTVDPTDPADYRCTLCDETRVRLLDVQVGEGGPAQQMEVPPPDITEDGRHHVWPGNAKLMFCPDDGRYHRFGCPHVRGRPALVPAAVRAWYAANWPSTERATA